MPIFITVPFLSYRAMAIYPFILLRSGEDKGDTILVNHELIHHRQQKELLIIPFYMIYLAHYLIGLARFRDHDKAYRNIIFEREAYMMDRDLTYLTRRKFMAFRQWHG